MINPDRDTITRLSNEAISLLQQLIQIPSVSRKEDETASFLFSYLQQKQVTPNRIANNIWAQNKHFDPSLPVLLLNSHHDTVPPNQSYLRDPYQSEIGDGKLYGLGSNDAGGPLVSLLAAFLYFNDQRLPFNIVFGASAEEEVSGKNGMELLLTALPGIEMAIVGEPTLMTMAIAEKGLLVLDCIARGKSGHAARDEGENALYIAMEDILRIRDLKFEKVSDFLGPVHLAVTSVETPNKAHNVVPDRCSFVVDVRVNEYYSFEEILYGLQSVMKSEIKPRSLRLKPSFIPKNHPLVQAGLQSGMDIYGSPTLSDMALMNFPAVKLGPGDSSRSHTADEFIFVSEIEEGIEKYIQLINNLSKTILK